MASMKPEKSCFCEHCGAPLTEYRHPLTSGLVSVLRKIWDWETFYGAKAVHVTELNLTYNQQSNMQKLRYWGFIAKADHHNPRSGYWLLTVRGQWFLSGKFSVPRTAVSFRGKLVRREGDLITIHQIERGSEYYVPYDQWLALRNGKGIEPQLRLAV